ncbi:MAG: DUF333 domain-containing protein [Ardenticatenaceae bacterium]|nr:DUF333 domain-containing protein [Ardenticatenaceae bacterium]
MKKLFAFTIILMVLAACTAPQNQAVPDIEETAPAALPNPAAVYCQQNGYTHEIHTAADGSQFGVCIFPDGKTCDEWAYYRGECGPDIQNAVTAVPFTSSSLDISLDTGSIATSFQIETITAVPAGDGVPYWEVLPEYTRLTLEDYPISNHLMQPQIFIFPVNDLKLVNEGAGQIVTSLQTLIQSPQEIPDMPFLPLFNAAQVLHVHVQYLDFKSGQGLRYLTEFAQGLMPINNYELIYTYQGLSSDGTYYVAAVLPITHSSLPADGTITGNEPPEFTSDFPTYVANMVNSLNPQAANTFTPDLTQLDVMMNSLEIK